MASGVFSVDVTTKSYTAQAGYTAYLYWSETSTGINGSTPYSVVSLTMKMKRLYSWAAAYNTGTGFAYNFKIDGTSNATGNVTYNSQTWTVGSEVTLWSKSVTINHNSDGSKTAAFRFEVTDTVLSDFTISGNAVLTNIPMASTLSLAASSVNLATSATLKANITRYSTAYYHRLVWKIGSTTVATINAGQVASYTYTLTAADWLTKMPNSASASCSCTLTTYSNSNYSTQIGSASTATFTLNCTANPTATLTSAPRGTAYNHGLTSYYYSGYSTALLTASGTGASGSTITKYAFYQGSSLIQSGTGTTKTTGTLSGTSAITFKVIVTDSRGRTGQATVTVTPIAYSAPSLTVNDCFRSNSSGTASSSGTYIRVKATATANASGNSITSLTVSTTTSTGTAVQTNVGLTSGTATTIGSGQYAITTAYNVIFSATDKMGNTVSVIKTVAATVVPAINVRNGGNGIAFGKYSEDANLVDFGWNARFAENALFEGLVGGKSNTSGRTYIVLVPYTTNNIFDVSSGMSIDFCKAWTKYICEQYPNKTYTTFVGNYTSGSRGFIVCNIYDTSDVDSDGIPRYATGIVCSYGNNNYILRFGTTGYGSNFYYNQSNNVGQAAGTLDIAHGGTGQAGQTAQQSWTPTITSGADATASVSSVVGRYKTWGMCQLLGGRFELTASITGLKISLPTTMSVPSGGVQVMGLLIKPDGTVLHLRSDGTNLNALSNGGSNVSMPTGYYAFWAIVFSI